MNQTLEKSIFEYSQPGRGAFAQHPPVADGAAVLDTLPPALRRRTPPRRPPVRLRRCTCLARPPNALLGLPPLAAATAAAVYGNRGSDVCAARTCPGVARAPAGWEPAMQEHVAGG